VKKITRGSVHAKSRGRRKPSGRRSRRRGVTHSPSAPHQWRARRPQKMLRRTVMAMDVALRHAATSPRARDREATNAT
jgi:hypothetical protein